GQLPASSHPDGPDVDRLPFECRPGCDSGVGDARMPAGDRTLGPPRVPQANSAGTDLLLALPRARPGAALRWRVVAGGHAEAAERNRTGSAGCAVRGRNR